MTSQKDMSVMGIFHRELARSAFFNFMDSPNNVEESAKRKKFVAELLNSLKVEKVTDLSGDRLQKALAQLKEYSTDTKKMFDELERRFVLAALVRAPAGQPWEITFDGNTRLVSMASSKFANVLKDMPAKSFVDAVRAGLISLDEAHQKVESALKLRRARKAQSGFTLDEEKLHQHLHSISLAQCSGGLLVEQLKDLVAKQARHTKNTQLQQKTELLVEWSNLFAHTLKEFFNFCGGTVTSFDSAELVRMMSEGKKAS